MVAEFGRSVDLTEEWLSKHKGHMLVWVKHTVFKGKQGIEYRECRCYTCTKVAQEALCEVSTVPQKKPEKEKSKRWPKKKDINDYTPNN
jgi:hypothetical protein